MHSMKGNKGLRDCGTVLKKNAKGEEYTWGLRFFKLLTECFKAWSIMDEKGDIAKSYDELRAGGVPMIEQVIYYEFDAAQLPSQHQLLERLISEEEVKSSTNPLQNNRESDNKYNSGFQMMYNSNNISNALTPNHPKVQNSNNILADLNMKTDYDKKTLKTHPVVAEFREMKQLYLDALFKEKIDPNRIVEGQICFQSYFDSQREELSRVLFGETYGAMDDKATDELLRDIEFGNSLHDLMEKENPKYTNPNDVEKMQKKVYELFKLAYNKKNSEYEAIINRIDTNIKKDTPDKPKYDTYETKVNKLDKTKVEEERDMYIYKEVEDNKISNFDSKPAKKQKTNIDERENKKKNHVIEDYKYDGYYEEDENMYNYDAKDLNIEEGNEVIIPIEDHRIHEEENRKLHTKRETLKKEVEELRKKERMLKMASEKSETFRGDADPKLLIEEIHKKNREYESLRSRYMGLMQQMNEKVHMDYSNTKNEKDYLQKSIMESVSMIENYRNRPRTDLRNETFRMPTTESYYMPKSMYKSSYNSKYL